MQKKFFSNLILLLALNLLVKPFYILGIDAEVQIRVGEEAYGNYFALLNFSFLLNILLDLGITNFNTRNIAQHPWLIRKHFYKLLSVRFLLFFLYAGFTFTGGVLTGFSSQEMELLSILVLNQFLVATVQFARSNFAGLHLFRTDALISVMDRVLLISFCAVLLWSGWTGIELSVQNFILAQTLAYGITAVVSIGLLLKEVGRIKFEFKRAFSRMMLRKSLPFALLILLMMFYNRIDAVMLERMLPDGDEQAGLYAQGFRLLDAVNMFALLFAGLLLPIFSRMLSRSEDVSELKYLAFRILLGTAIIVGVSSAFYADFIMALRYPNPTAAGNQVFALLILSFIPVCITYIYGTLLTANGSLKALNLMALSGLVLNLVLNAVLIPQYKAEGAALATLITQVVTALIQIVLVYRILEGKFSIVLYLRMIIFTGCVLGIVALSGQWLDKMSVLAFIGMMLVMAIVAFITGVFRMADIRLLLSKSSENHQE